MRVVVDANVLFALAKHSSAANDIFSRFGLELVAPDFSMVELYKYREALEKKSENGPFEEIMSTLKRKVTFVDVREYGLMLKTAQSLLPDIKDAAYLALALKLRLPIWSNDRHLSDQSVTLVFSTEELIDLLSR